MLDINPRPDFERIRTTLMCGQADRVPVMELSVDKPVKEAYLGKALSGSADEHEFWLRAGYDCHCIWPGYNWNPARLPGKEAPRVTTFQRSLYEDEPVERSWRCERKGVITSLEDFEAHIWPEKGDFGDGDLGRHAASLPDGMKLIPVTCIHENVATLLGTETLLVGIYDDPELVARTYARVGEWVVSIYERLAPHPAVGALWLGDDLAYTEGMFFSPDFAREHILPWYAQVADIARAHDLPLLFHSDGDIRPIIPDLIQLGVNAIHPIEPKGMDIAEIKRDFGDRLCLLGNLDLCYTLPRGTPEEVREEVRVRIGQAGHGGGYCVSSANSVTEYVPLANFEAMVAAALEFGRYG